MTKNTRRVLIVPFSILILSILLQGCGPLSEQGAADDSASVNPNRFNPVLSTAFAEPWPTQVTRQELIDTALYKSFAFLDTLPNEQCGVDVNFYFQDTWVQDQVDVVQTTSSGMIELLCNYLSEDVHVIGGDYDFVKETIAKNDGLSFSDFCDWFRVRTPEPMAIIHFTGFRYNK